MSGSSSSSSSSSNNGGYSNTSLNFVSYLNNKDMAGTSYATAKFLSPIADIFSNRDAMINQVDPKDSSLSCKSVTIDWNANDTFAGWVQLTANYVAPSRIAPLIADSACQIRYEVSGETFTLTEGTVPTVKPYWYSDNTSLVNKVVLPTKTIALVKVILSGVRTTWSLSNISGYIDKVNSDVWQGATAETVLFHSFNANIRPDGKWAVEYELQYKEVGWNNFWNETTQKFDKLIIGLNGQTAYDSTSFANLLMA